MSEAALQDAQWLEALPENLDCAFDNFFWSQPDAAQAWFNAEEPAELVSELAQVGKTNPNPRQQVTLSKKSIVELFAVLVCVMFFQSL